MTETNIRLVQPGNELYIYCRFAQVIAQDVTPELLQRACNALKQRGCAAVPSPTNNNELLVVRHEPISPLVLKEEDLRVEIIDKGRSNTLRFVNNLESPMIAALIERCLLIEIERRTKMWTLDSPRILYACQPEEETGDFAAFRRFEVSAIPIEEHGIGIAVHITTAFFSKQSVADFFRSDIPKERQQVLRKRFEWLSQRQKGQKATLLYDMSDKKHKCYFDEFKLGETCVTTGVIRVKGHDYKSLYEYYQLNNNHIKINPDDPIAHVSFPGLERSVPVAANRLYLRVMNEVLPYKLKQLDKIDPTERRRLIQLFWKKLGSSPLGHGNPKVASNFWEPEKKYSIRIKPPDLQFADKKTLAAPNNSDLIQNKKYFQKRRLLLNRFGCLQVPPIITRVVKLVAPRKAKDVMVTRLADDIAAQLSTWTKRTISIPNPLKYDNLHQVLSTLRGQTPGYVLFVFEESDPAAYFEVSHELKAWRVKRITYNTLQNHFTKLQSGQIGKWQSFVELSALDLLQLMDCVPWTLSTPLHYDAQLAIDVGWDRRHFALSLLICRHTSEVPSFWLDTVVEAKADTKHETINPIHLRDKIVALVQRAAADRKRFDPLCSMLVLRDGRECGHELKAIDDARSELIKLKLFMPKARIDIIDVHKKSLKGIRYWEKNDSGELHNVLEGTALFLDKKTALITNTGAATLHQGTAEPLMLVAHKDNVDMRDIVSDVNATSHLNWSSPTVAQKLPIVLKRTDEQLENRILQEIRRI